MNSERSTMRTERTMWTVVDSWKVGEYTFEAVELPGGVFYQFRIEGKSVNHELYASLDEALVAAVGEKWTGQRGAGGTGVDTAAGWFMRMIGATGDAG